MLLAFLEDWVTRAIGARIEITPDEVRIAKSIQRWTRRRMIRCERITHIARWMGSIRIRRRGRWFDLATISCCGEGDQQWLAERLREEMGMMSEHLDGRVAHGAVITGEDEPACPADRSPSPSACAHGEQPR
jgi:hypothetical protein